MGRRGQLVGEAHRLVDGDRVPGGNRLNDRTGRDRQRVLPRADVTERVGDGARDVVLANAEWGTNGGDGTRTRNLQARVRGDRSEAHGTGVVGRWRQLISERRRVVNGRRTRQGCALDYRAGRDRQGEGPGPRVAICVGVGPAEGVTADLQVATGGHRSARGDLKTGRVARRGHEGDAAAITAGRGQLARVRRRSINRRGVRRESDLADRARRDGEREGPGARVTQSVGRGTRDSVGADLERAARDRDRTRARHRDVRVRRGREVRDGTAVVRGGNDLTGVAGRTVDRHRCTGRRSLQNRAGCDREGVRPRTRITQSVGVGTRHGVGGRRQRDTVGRDGTRARNVEPRTLHDRHVGDRGAVVRRGCELSRKGRRTIHRRRARQWRCLKNCARCDAQRERPRARVTEGVGVGARDGVDTDRERRPDNTDSATTGDTEVRVEHRSDVGHGTGVVGRRRELTREGRRTIHRRRARKGCRLNDRAGRDRQCEGPRTRVAISVGVGSAEGVTADLQVATGGYQSARGNLKTGGIAGGGHERDPAAIATGRGQLAGVGRRSVDRRGVRRESDLADRARRDVERERPGPRVAEGIRIRARCRVGPDLEWAARHRDRTRARHCDVRVRHGRHVRDSAAVVRGGNDLSGVAGRTVDRRRGTRRRRLNDHDGRDRQCEGPRTRIAQSVGVGSRDRVGVHGQWHSIGGDGARARDVETSTLHDRHVRDSGAVVRRGRELSREG